GGEATPREFVPAQGKSLGRRGCAQTGCGNPVPGCVLGDIHLFGDFLGSVIACGFSSPQCGEKYSLFLRFSPWRDPRLRHFAGYPFGASRKKASTIFYNTAIS
ncbi:hypothetical protein, partial [uncultured Bilophila sp.]|uniref:hypothetical protein n=1 Tax=uncultured Bilophila sp. TaxID=529385 RepID=UPI00280B44F4